MKISDIIYDYVELTNTSENVASDGEIQKELWETWLDHNFKGDYFKLIDLLIKEPQDISECTCYNGYFYIDKKNKKRLLEELNGSKINKY